MRKPNLNFDITKAVKDFTHKKLADFETKIIMYVIEKKGIKNFDVSKFSRKSEKVKNYGAPIHTLRYDGIFIFRRFIGDFNGLQYRYEIDV